MLKPPPLFTFKHYAVVIKVLRATRPAIQTTKLFTMHDLLDIQYHSILGHNDEWDEMVRAFSDMFAADNPKFKADLFRQECNK